MALFPSYFINFKKIVVSSDEVTARSILGAKWQINFSHFFSLC